MLDRRSNAFRADEPLTHGHSLRLLSTIEGADRMSDLKHAFSAMASAGAGETIGRSQLTIRGKDCTEIEGEKSSALDVPLPSPRFDLRRVARKEKKSGRAQNDAPCRPSIFR
jgi:hypothetical protein